MHSKKEIRFTAEDLQACKELATTVEAAEFLLALVIAKIESSPDPKRYQSIRTNLENYLKNVKLERERPSAMRHTSLKDVRTDFGNLQENLKNSVREFLENMDPNAPITFGFKFNDDEFQRAFAQHGKPISKEALEALDILFNACLTENNMLCEDHIIYDANDKYILKDSAGNFIQAKKEKIAEIIREKFQDFLNHTTGKNFTINSKQFESTTKAEAVPPAPVEAAAPVEKAPAAEVPAEEPTQKPTTGPGAAG